MNTIILKKMFSRMRFKIALRNITRHRLRSLLSISMIAGAVCSIILFHGLSDFVLESLKHIAAENQFGNMQIAKDKYWAPGKEGRKLRMFNLDELKQLKELHPEVIKVSGRLSFFGLVSNGDLSIGGKVIGVDTIGEPNFTKSMRIMSGKFFNDNNAKEGMIGQLLAKQMNVKPGDNITVLTNTVDGVMNAMDLTVSGIFSAGIDEIDSQVIYIPLGLTQTILDTPNVDIAVLKFAKLAQSETSAPIINRELKAGNTLLRARTWQDLAVLFRQCEKFYAVQNRLIEAILLALMFLGILNSVSMTVVERTGEIGTLRSFGESRSDIISQFVLESLLLTLVGTIVGSIGSWAIIQIIHIAKIATEMPGVSVPFTLHLNFLFSSVFYASFLALATSVIATYIPAKRAAHMNIVDALRKNI
ncbi:MAG: FtsX-like permease family protein [Bacteriovorax sp.]|nr:FtsX-like permease family protein [Bacteriovorax sp.]